MILKELLRIDSPETLFKSPNESADSSSIRTDQSEANLRTTAKKSQTE